MNRSELFNKLESLRHMTCENYQYSLFEQTPQNAEYWMASDLEQLFGIGNMPWRNNMRDDMYSLMARNVIPSSKTPTDEIFRHHVIPISSPAGMKTYDMKLSRYAAWILTVENPRMAFTRAYFMMPGHTADEMSYTANNLTRMHNHDILSQYNRRIAGILDRDNIPFFRFYADLHGTFFGTADTNAIKAQNGIRITARDSIHNYMGTASMRAMANGIDMIIQRYDENGRRNADALSYITVREMGKARTEMATKTNRVPAMDIEKMHINDLRFNIRNAEHAFVKKFINEKLR